LDIDFGVGDGDWRHGELRDGDHGCVVAQTGQNGRVVQSARFFDGMYGGLRATFLFLAILDKNQPLGVRSAPEVAEIAGFVLQFDDEPSEPSRYFKTVSKYTTIKKYSDSDLALWCEWSVPLPKKFVAVLSDKMEKNLCGVH
jgi:hypothetical protein